MSDLQRWVIAVLLGAFGGLVQAASDTSAQNARDYIRHAAVGIAPAIAALQMTLHDAEKRRIITPDEKDEK